MELRQVDFDPFAKSPEPQVSPQVQLERDRNRLTILENELKSNPDDENLRKEIVSTKDRLNNGQPWGRGSQISAELKTPKVMLRRVDFDPFAGPDAGVRPSDLVKSGVAGAAAGAGAIAQGGGELLARGINLVGGKLGFDPEARAINPLQGAVNDLLDARTTAAKKAEAGSQISGELLKPSEWSFGNDPSVAGLAIQGMNAIGQMAPNLGVALITAGASIPAQLAIGTTVGGLQGLGAGAEQERGAIAAMSHDDLLAKSKLYKELIDKGVPQDTAKAAVSEAAALGGGLGNAIPSAMEGAFEDFLVGALTRGRIRIPSLGAGVAGRIATGVIGGGAMGGTEEAVEQAAQNVGSNIAIGGDRPAAQDTLQNFVMGMIAEGAAGGGAGALSAGKPHQAAQPNNVGTTTPADNVGAAPPAEQVQSPPAAAQGPIEYQAPDTGLSLQEPPKPTAAAPAVESIPYEPVVLASPIEQARKDAEVLKAGGMPEGADDTRLRNATLISLYGENAAVRHAIESPELGAVGDAMLLIAPKVEQVRKSLSQAEQSRDITTDVMTAVDELGRIKSAGVTVAEIMKHGFPGQVSYEAEQLIQFLDQNAQDSRKIADFMERYLQIVEDMGGVPSDVRGKAFDIIAERNATKREAEEAQARAQLEGAKAKQVKTETQIATEQAMAENALTEMAKARVSGGGINPEHQTAMEIAFENARQKKEAKNAKQRPESAEPGGETAARPAKPIVAADERSSTKRAERVSGGPETGNAGNARSVRENGGEQGTTANPAEAVKRVEEAAKEAAHSPHSEARLPTPAQHDAGNYQKGHVRLFGLDISIENPKGSVRTGVANGEPWAVKLQNHYGYIRKTEGADGDHVDVYLGDHLTEDAPVFVVDQRDPETKRFDEHKVVLGARGFGEAKEIYDNNFSDDSAEKRRGAVSKMTLPQFKQWLKGDTTKPVKYKEPKTERRADQAQRKRIAEMSPAEMRKALLTDDLTGLGNRRAYEEAEKQPTQVSIDVDALKWVNDNLGHESGDRLLKLMGEAIAAETGNGFHISGDEFVVQAATSEEADAVMQRVTDRLKAAEITVQRPDGTKVTKKGVEFSYGKGANLSEAETGLQSSKAAREAAGLRPARGTEPAGVATEPAAGQQDSRRQAVAFRRGEGRGLARDTLDAIVSRIKTSFPNAAEVETLGAITEAPQALLAHIKRVGGDDIVQAAWWNGKVYAFAENIASEKDAEFAILHEFGHDGLRKLFGAELDPLLRSVYDGSVKVQLEVAKLRRKFPDLSVTQATEEYLADVAGSGQRQSWLEKVIAFVRDFLRSKGLVSTFSDSDILAILARARGALTGQQEFTPAGVMFSRNLGTLTADQELALKNVHGEPATWQAKLNTFRQDWKKNLIQGVFDQYAPILDYTQKGYRLARQSKGGDSALEALLMYGKVYVDPDGAYKVQYTHAGGMQGFAKVIAALKGEQDRFLEWVAAHRAERLASVGLENLYTAQDITALKSLDQGVMKDGTPRAPAYAQALRSLNDWNDSVLKIAVDSGLIDDATRLMYKDMPYVPFYRLQEDNPGFGMKAGLVNQAAWKKLKGGTAHLNDDLLANVLQNWSHIITASAKNRAATETLQAAAAAGVAHQVPAGTPGKGLVHYMDAGKEKVFAVDDAHLMDAIAAMHYAGLGDIGKPFVTMKRWLTTGVTVNPAFKIRNLIRDSIQAIGTAELSYNPLKNIRQGYKAVSEESETRAQLLAGGGMIRFGSMLDGNNADRTRRLIEKGVDPDLILDNAGKLERFWKQRLVPAFEAYQELGDKGEQISRAALYEQLLAKGMTHAEAAFWARDLMDFSLSGKWTAVRILTQVVPFMNARLQGLYKLGRATKADYRRMGTTLGAVALSSMALLLAYRDDDDWKRREDFDRDNYWWFKIGGLAFRMPKPFEIGAMGTLAERGLEYMISDEMTGSRFADRLSATVFNQLSMNPTPQLMKPLLDIYANKDSFTGRPVETMGMERLRKEDRATERTSEIAKALGQIGLPDPTQLAMGQWNTLSPVQIDSLIRGYFGWVGSSATTALDWGIRPAMDRGQRPDMKLKDVFLAGNFMETLPSGSSRYVTQLYDQAAAIEQAYGSYRDALKRGDVAKAQEVQAEEADKIAKYHLIETIKRGESEINAQIRLIEASKSLGGDQKRVRIDRLNDAKDKLGRLLAIQR